MEELKKDKLEELREALELNEHMANSLSEEVKRYTEKAAEIRKEIMVESVDRARFFYHTSFGNDGLESIGKVVSFLSFCESLGLKWKSGCNPLNEHAIDTVDDALHDRYTVWRINISDEGKLTLEVI
ncbi:hypothetical protein RASY3_14445 [Ruminococcus albus SY3]|uniref:Uncharacterized protein n=1 Tax=Ruminococcus albus SY3 TaxID=1341156 RepID=A0A011UD52_RUMAL|nr:hypothetical protein [Ruminococcus albus]EXM38524.1 hypothetical protein RASY3_14445 [Ruminococcus albus SY3]